MKHFACGRCGELTTFWFSYTADPCNKPQQFACPHCDSIMEVFQTRNKRVFIPVTPEAPLASAWPTSPGDHEEYARYVNFRNGSFANQHVRRRIIENFLLKIPHPFDVDANAKIRDLVTSELAYQELHYQLAYDCNPTDAPPYISFIDFAKLDMVAQVIHLFSRHMTGTGRVSREEWQLFDPYNPTTACCEIHPDSLEGLRLGLETNPDVRRYI